VKKLRVGIIYGGRSGEHEVSLASAAAVFANLDPARYEAIPIRIEKDGRWTLPERPPTLPSAADVLQARDNEPDAHALEALVAARPGGDTLITIDRALPQRPVVAGLALVWPRLRPPWDLVMGGAIVTSLPVISAVVFANVNSLILLLLAMAVRWPRAAGLALGVATALKVAPVFAFAWLIGRRDWSGVAMGLAVAAGLTLGAALLIDPNAVVDFIVVRWNELPRPGPLATGLTTFGLPATVGYLLAATLAVLAATRASLLLAVLACLAAVPVLHAHYWTWLLVPILARGTPLLVPATGMLDTATETRERVVAEPSA